MAAAQVSLQPRGGYQRVNFTFDKPARISVTNANNRIVLRFDTPLGKSPEQIAQLLKDYVTGASLSADKRTLTLTTTKRYRTRHFVSGNTVGLDLIGATAEDGAEDTTLAALEPDDELAAEPLLTTRKPPEPAKPAPKPSAKPDVKPEAKPEVKKPAPATPAATAPATPPAPTPPPVDDAAMLTTKAPAPEPVAPVEAPPAPKAAPAPAQPAPAPLSEPPSAVERAAQAPQPAPDETTVAEAVRQGPFMVTARTNSDSTVINFPYSTRTAAAVFERGNATWVVFSRPADANAERLRSVLPKSVTGVTQYHYPDHTVLRLTTDGTVHASAQTSKGSYGWDITLSTKAAAPVRDIAVSIDTADDKRRLMLGAFDVAPTLSFYDPAAGDLLMVLPSYEGGLGVANSRNFPEFSLLGTAQGIAIVSAGEHITTHASRLGVALESARGLALSKGLGVLDTGGAPMAGLSSGVMLPYELWHVPPAAFRSTLQARQQTLATSTKETRASNMLALATLYLGQGMGSEALGYLDLIRANEPEFYTARKLALLSAAAHALKGHPDMAAESLAAPELADLPEAALWREYTDIFRPRANAIQMIQQAAQQQPAPTSTDATEGTPAAATPAPAEPEVNAIDLSGDSESPPSADAPAQLTGITQPLMQFLKYNTSYIRFYPPRIRHMLAAAAADAYIANGLQEKAVTVFDTLTRDGILPPLTRHAEYAVAMVAVKGKKYPQAEELLKHLSTQGNDPHIRARARTALAMLELSLGKKTAAETADTLESIRLTWRGDALERDILKTLADLYKGEKRYDDALRTYKILHDEFASDPEFLNFSTAMTELFEQLYVKGLAEEMPPLKSLSLFYEFRDLTPIGTKGDLIIQRLADRLAAFDLIDRATQLLENQVAFRVGGEERSRIGARLALLYLLNQQPQEALKVIEVTNYGSNPPELQRQRMQLAARALTGLKRYEEALSMLYYDTTETGTLLKLDILWTTQDWPNIINAAEDILAKRTDLTAPLTPTETEVLIKLALGYSFEGDYNQLRYLRDYYAALLPESAYKQIFDYITNDTAPLDREDSALLTQQISRTESFLDTFREKIAAGKLSEAIQ